MSRSAADPSAGTRVALVGAASPDGLRLREALARSGVPGARVDLYGTTHGEVVLSEYDGEARLVQEPQPGEIGSHDLIFICETGELPRRLAAAAPPETLIVDLVGALDGADPLPRVLMDLNPDEARSGRDRLAVPHALSILLVEILAPLDRELGVAEVVGLVTRPAADFGEAGVEELREQTVRLLNFATIPVETFGKQLAFNLLPQSSVARDTPGLERTVARELAGMFGWDRPRAALAILVAPVFYGHCVQLRVKFRGQADAARAGEILGREGLVAPESGETMTTPMDVSGERTTRVHEITDDGIGGCWILAVAGEAAGRSAENAVRLANALRDLGCGGRDREI